MDSPQPPTTGFEINYPMKMKILVTGDREAYVRGVKKRLVVFSWNEMNRLLDAEPSEADLRWALTLKKHIPGTRIDDIVNRKATYPKKKANKTQEDQE